MIPPRTVPRWRQVLATLPLDALLCLALIAAGPLWLLRRAFSARGLPVVRARFAPPPRPAEDAGPLVWLHAVSVGETRAAVGLVRELIARGYSVRRTVTTQAGYETGRKLLPEVPIHHAPLDLGPLVRAWIRRWRPAALVLVELELWPNLLNSCRMAGVPVALVNGRLSERSARGYGRFSGLLRGALGSLRVVCAQDEEHAARFRALGRPAETVLATGNLKYDGLSLREDGSEVRAALAAEHGTPADARWIVGGSTHPGEDEALVAAWRRLRESEPELRLLLAPRHSGRVDPVLALAREGERWARRSAPDDVANPDVLVVDTMGELARLYALGSVCLVGGSLVPVGGHNPLEAALFGSPLVMGRHVDSVRRLAADLVRSGVLSLVEPAALEGALGAALNDEALRRRAADGIAQVLARNHGSLSRTLEPVLTLLHPRSS